MQMKRPPNCPVSMTMAEGHRKIMFNMKLPIYLLEGVKPSRKETSALTPIT